MLLLCLVLSHNYVITINQYLNQCLHLVLFACILSDEKARKTFYKKVAMCSDGGEWRDNFHFSSNNLYLYNYFIALYISQVSFYLGLVVRRQKRNRLGSFFYIFGAWSLYACCAVLYYISTAKNVLLVPFKGGWTPALALYNYKFSSATVTVERSFALLKVVETASFA